MSRKDRLKNSSVESEKIIKEIKQAQNDIKNAENFFQNVTDIELIDVAIYELEAKKSKYQYLIKIAKEKGIKVQHGVYIGTQGPTFETPAEYKLFHILGADAVGMSTVPEVIVANHCGIKVFGISVITDLGVEGKIVEVTHEEVQKAADAAQPKMTTIMRELINRA